MPVTAMQPLQLLAHIESRSRQNAFGLPQQTEIKSSWSGIAFRLGSTGLVAPVDEVREILTVPRLTRVPGTKPWVRGIANVRGTLLTIVDLSAYLDGARTPIDRRTRVLVAQHSTVTTGVMVSEVLGLRHFLEEDAISEFSHDGSALREFLRGGYRHGGDHWGVFSLNALAEGQQFLQVAI